MTMTPNSTALSSAHEVHERDFLLTRRFSGGSGAALLGGREVGSGGAAQPWSSPLSCPWSSRWSCLAARTTAANRSSSLSALLPVPSSLLTTGAPSRVSHTRGLPLKFSHCVMAMERRFRPPSDFRSSPPTCPFQAAALSAVFSPVPVRATGT